MRRDLGVALLVVAAVFGPGVVFGPAVAGGVPARTAAAQEPRDEAGDGPASVQEEANTAEEGTASTDDGVGTENSCIACHGDPELMGAEELEAIVEPFRHGAHAEVNLSCHDCHGGNPDPSLALEMSEAMDPDYEPNPYLGVPEPAGIPEFCGRCHSDPTYMRRFEPDARTDQVQEYWTSQHGRLLEQGDTNVATCTDCHGVHGILGPGNPDSPVYPTRVAETCRSCHSDPQRMAGYELAGGRPLPVDQYERWTRSVHADALLDREDLSAPTCNDCHGNHGATPPGVDSITYVCGQCHGREAELFRQSSKQVGFEEHNEIYMDGGDIACGDCHEPSEPQAHVTGIRTFSECSTCHGNHAVVRPTVALLGPLPETPCAFCHEGPAPAAEPYREPEESRRNYEETKADLLTRAGERDLTGDRRFDWLVDQLLRLPNHTQGSAEAEGGPMLRPEFRRLFEKFRIGKTHFTYVDPASGEEVTESITRCTDCHGAEPEFADEAVGHAMSQEFLASMRELTVLTARAERILLTAHRGGVAVADTREALDGAVDAQIELEALVHTFSTAADGAFAETHREGIEHARSAVEAGRAALEELAFRRRGLAVSLVIILLVLIGLGWKIRRLS